MGGNRRRIVIPANPMTRAELQAFKRTVGLLSLEQIERELQNTINHFSVRPLASPRLVQELVAFWQTLWKRRNESRRHFYN